MFRSIFRAKIAEMRNEFSENDNSCFEILCNWILYRFLSFVKFDLMGVFIINLLVMIISLI